MLEVSVHLKQEDRLRTVLRRKKLSKFTEQQKKRKLECRQKINQSNNLKIKLTNINHAIKVIQKTRKLCREKTVLKESLRK